MSGPAAALRELSARVLYAGGPDDVVATLATAARDSLGVDRVHVAEISQDAAIGHTTAFGFEAGGAEQARYVQVLQDRPSGIGAVIASGRPWAVPDARSAEDIRTDYVRRFDVASASKRRRFGLLLPAQLGRRGAPRRRPAHPPAPPPR